jgi:hypothetical protein
MDIGCGAQREKYPARNVRNSNGEVLNRQINIGAGAAPNLQAAPAPLDVKFRLAFRTPQFAAKQ